MDTSRQEFQVLLIGVEDYGIMTRLQGPTHDAEQLEDVIRESSIYPRTKGDLIVGPNATLATVRTALKSIALVSTNAIVLIYFSGHGGRLKSRDGGNENDEVYLCLNDTDDRDYEHTAISGEEFGELLGQIKAKHLFVILDCCHAGGFDRTKGARSRFEPQGDFTNRYLDRWVHAKGGEGGSRLILASSLKDQPSEIDQRQNLSIFTIFLLKGLRGAAAQKGIVTIAQLVSYLQQSLKEYRQTPISHGTTTHFPLVRIKPSFSISYPLSTVMATFAFVLVMLCVVIIEHTLWGSTIIGSFTLANWLVYGGVCFSLFPTGIILYHLSKGQQYPLLLVSLGILILSLMCLWFNIGGVFIFIIPPLVPLFLGVFSSRTPLVMSEHT